MIDTNTIMIIGLLINFLAMVGGGFRVIQIIISYHIKNERRLATIEEQIQQLMRHNNMKVRAEA